MLLRLPAKYSGLAKYEGLAFPIREITVTAAEEDMQSCFGPFNPSFHRNVTDTIDRIAYGIANLADNEKKRPGGFFAINLAASDENMRTVTVGWEVSDWASTESAYLPAA